MVDPTNLRPTWAEVNLDNIAYNVRLLRGRTAPGARFMAVVKADGYGHGAVQVAGTALKNGADWLAVAIIDEGILLRREGFTAPILVLGYTPPEQAGRGVAHDLTLTVYRRDLAEALARAGSAAGKTARVHVKVDTGMGRIGLEPEREAVEFIASLSDLPNLEVEGLFTHFAVADSLDKSFTREQFSRFRRLIDDLEKRGIHIPVKHAANSAAIIDLPETHLDMVRAGIAMYGLAPSSEVGTDIGLRPAMEWKTRIAHVKKISPGTSVSYGRKYVAEEETVVATLPVGYADGYSRAWSNRGTVIVGGRRAPVIGRVCMDQTMIALPPDTAAAVGDEVVLMGRQGEAAVTADDLAEGLGTINYEITCLVGKRVPRVYIKNGRTLKILSVLG